MDDRQAIEQRIRAFISDYDDWNRDCFLNNNFFDGMPLPCEIDPFAKDANNWRAGETAANRGDVDRPRRSLEQLSLKHCTDASVAGEPGISFGNISMHDPENEHIADVRLCGDRAVVGTDCLGGIFRSWEYALVKQSGTWRIERLTPFGSEDETPASPPDWEDGDFRKWFETSDDAGIDFDAAFRPGSRSHNGESGNEEVIAVTVLGEIDLPSGLLVAVEASESPADARPLEVRFPAVKKLTVELARSGFHNAFVRVRLASANPVVSYVPARVVGMPGEEQPAQAMVGVRCGAFVLADAVEWASANPREVERLSRTILSDYDKGQPEWEPARLVSVPGADQTIGALINRGGGDVSCPCYWGVDKDGLPVVLVVDLGLCEDRREESIDLPFSVAWLTREKPIPQFTEFGFNLVLGLESDGRISVRASGECPTIDLFNQHGSVIGSTERNGMVSTVQESLQWISFAPPLRPDFCVRLRWQTSRHGFARQNG